MKKFGPGDFRWRLLPKPAAAAVVMAIVALCLTNSAPAFAQPDPFGWFEQWFRPPPSNRVAKPRPEFHRATPRERPRWSYPSAERAPRRFQEKPGAKGIAKAPAKPAVAPTYFVAVLGDNLGQMLAQGLTDAFVNRPEVAILHKAKNDSGLVRDDFFDWVKATQDLLASGEKVDFAVMLIGSNDRQTLHDANGSYEPGTPEWQAAYTQRIEIIAAMFRDKKIPLVWVGLPILKSDRLSADALTFNQLYHTYAEKDGAIYVDVWEAFADEAGKYSASGPDIDGQIVKLRTADGIHFTKAGARKLAHFVEPEIRRKLDEAQPAPEAGVTPGVAPNPANAPSDGTGASTDVSALPQDEAVAPPPKPVAGPVLPLTAPALAPRGELATAVTAAAPANSNARNLIEQTLQEGKPIAPKPGRADDFSWPRP
ncbi:MAG TPA: SGNH family hydrolase [Methylocella sp.]|nr:SGNH family hydrolase [Methylocella sp.]